jgi:hypothetical protein
MNESKTASPLAAKTYRANDVVSCVDEGEDGAMLYNPDKDDTVLLNPSGRGIWALLAAPRTMEEIAGHLAAAYPDVTPEKAAQDAEQFIQSLAPDFIVPSPNEP